LRQAPLFNTPHATPKACFLIDLMVEKKIWHTPLSA
jgi:hypothetical protein